MIYISDDEYSQMNANHERGEREKLEVEVKKLRFELNNLKREVKALKNQIKKGNNKVIISNDDDTWFHPFKD